MFVFSTEGKPSTCGLTVVHVAVALSRVYLNRSQVVLLCFGLLPLKEEGRILHLNIKE